MDAFEGLAKLLEGTGEAGIAAQNAAAKVYQSAISVAAPRKTGQLASSVKVYESKNRAALTGETRARVLIGPSKEKGYYGYFIDRGWNATGSKPRERKSSGTTHGQKGVSGGRKITGSGWFESAIRSADSTAEAAAEAAFEATMSKKDSEI